MSARGEPFDSPLILSLSKDERLAQDRLVEPCERCVQTSHFSQALQASFPREPIVEVVARCTGDVVSRV